jgi:hypothetical protein
VRQLNPIVRAAVSAAILVGVVPGSSGHYWIGRLRLEEVTGSELPDCPDLTAP